MAQRNDTDLVGQRLQQGNQAHDLLAELLNKDAEIGELNNQRPSAGDTLRSTPGVLAALASIATIAAGQPEAGAEMLNQLIGGAEGAAVTAQQRIDQQRTKLLQERQQSRSAAGMLVQAQPQLFLDEEGKDIVDPYTMGQLLLGRNVAISPASMLAQQRRSARESANMEASMRLALSADTPEGRATALRVFNREGAYGLSEEEINSLARVDTFDQMVPLMLQYFEPVSAALVLYELFSNGQTIQERPDLLMMLAPRMSERATTQVQLDVEDAERISTWVMADPANRMQLTIVEQAEGAFANDPGNLSRWKARNRHLMEDDPMSQHNLTRLYQNMTKLLMELSLMSETAAKEFNIADEEAFSARVKDLTISAAQSARAVAALAHVKSLSELHNIVAANFIDQLMAEVGIQWLDMNDDQRQFVLNFIEEEFYSLPAGERATERIATQRMSDAFKRFKAEYLPGEDSDDGED
jgi:hypothetical protein